MNFYAPRSLFLVELLGGHNYYASTHGMALSSPMEWISPTSIACELPVSQTVSRSNLLFTERGDNVLAKAWTQ